MVSVWFCKCLLSIYQAHSARLDPGDREVLCCSEGAVGNQGVRGEAVIAVWQWPRSVSAFSLVPNNRYFLTCKWIQFFSYALVFF